MRGALDLGARSIVLVATGLAAGACGSGSTQTRPSNLLDPSQPRSPDAMVIISPAGVQPQDSHLDHPVTVTFVNRDSVAHTPESAPEIGNGDCPEMSQVGRLEPGQSGTVTIDKANYICSYHDALQPAVLKFKGILVVH